MTGATGWGRRVAAVVPALVAGCAGAAKQEPVSEPRPVVSAAPVGSAPAVGSARAEVAALVPTLTTSAPGAYGTVTSWGVRYGRGVLRMSVDYGSFGDVVPCRLRGGDADTCAMFSVSTTGKEPADDDWRGRPEPPGTRATVPRRPPVSWTSLSPGRDAVYGFAYAADQGVDRIDERGEVTEWLAREDLPEGTSSASVLEVGARRFVLASDVTRGHLAEAREGRPGEKVTVSGWSDVPICHLPVFRQSAQGIRQVEQSGEPGAAAPRVLVGTPVAVALPAASEWAMVWIEGVAPPYAWQAGKVWKSPRKSRHECSSGPPSRPVSDVSVDKLVHLTRMRDTKVVSDVVLRSDSLIDPGHALAVRAVDRGVEVDGVTYSLAGKAAGGKVTAGEKGLGQSTLSPGRDEEVQMLSFDARPGGAAQGVMVVRAGEEHWLRTFDARGVFVSEAVKVPTTRRPLEARDDISPLETMAWSTAARQGDRWVLADESGRHLLFMPGATVVDLPGTLTGARFVKVGDRPHLVNVVDVGLYEADVDLATRKVSDPVRRAFEPLPQQPHTVIPLEDSGTVTWLALAQDPGEGHAWKLWKLAPGATGWQAAVTQKKTDGYHPMRVMQTWAGPVLSFLDGDTTRLRWLRTGEERAAGLDDGAFLNALPPEQGDPLVTVGEEGQWGLVPSRPGALVMGAADRMLVDGCTHAVMTGPTTAVLACSEPIEAMRPGMQAGLRLVTLGR